MSIIFSPFFFLALWMVFIVKSIKMRILMSKLTIWWVNTFYELHFLLWYWKEIRTMIDVHWSIKWLEVMNYLFSPSNLKVIIKELFIQNLVSHSNKFLIWVCSFESYFYMTKIYWPLFNDKSMNRLKIP
jgi:hypothetical protein